jgi:uncharacterized protein GlcG (DUF336 family)
MMDGTFGPQHSVGACEHRKGATVMHKILLGGLAAATLAAATATWAQRPAQALTAESAETIVQACKRHAKAGSRNHAIAVVDSGGNLVAALRMDGTTPGVMAFATEKARAAAMWGFPTSGMEQAAKNLPGFADAPYVVALGGGVPIYSADGQTLLGGVGTSGASAADDAACGEAGIKEAGLAASRPAPPQR